MNYDPFKLAASLCTRKRCAVDGGANQGKVTAAFLHYGFERVLAIEPGPSIETLQARFGYTKSVEIHQVALGDVHNKMVWFGPPAPGKAKKLWYADATRPGTVQMVRFDDHFTGDTSIDLVKLDLEGGELEALRGMYNTIRTCRPVVVCETADWIPQHKDGPGRRLLFNYMEGLGYKVAGRFKGDTVWKFGESHE